MKQLQISDCSDISMNLSCYIYQQENIERLDHTTSKILSLMNQ